MDPMIMALECWSRILETILLSISAKSHFTHKNKIYFLKSGFPKNDVYKCSMF
jgi:hypothetical protein